MLEIDPYKPGNSRFWKLRNDARIAPVPCRWPLPRLAGHDPVAISTVDASRKGVDIGYVPTPSFFNDLFIPVYAVNRGDVAFAANTENGYAITIDHGSWCSHYAQLSKMFVMPNLHRTKRLQSVKPGEVIGYAARSPLHIRFEIWEQTYTEGWRAVDPSEQLNTWTIERPENALRSPTIADQPQAA